MAKTLVPDADALHPEELCAEEEAITLVVTAVRTRRLPALRSDLLARP